MTYVDRPDKKEKHPHYENKIEKLDKHYFFKAKDFHQIRKISTHKKLKKAFTRISMCLNDKMPAEVPIEGLDQVCFMVINDYEKDKISELGVGPLNDGYLFGITQYRMDFNIFYLYNSKIEEFTSFLAFFMKNTQKILTVYYTGRSADGNQGILFDSGILSKDSIADIIASNCNGKARYIFVNDCPTGGTNFDIPSILHQNKPIKNLLSFSVDKTKSHGYKDAKRTHGLLTFYLCKTINDYPIINPNDLIEKMTQELRRFQIKFDCAITDQELANNPIFF